MARGRAREPNVLARAPRSTRVSAGCDDSQKLAARPGDRPCTYWPAAAVLDRSRLCTVRAPAPGQPPHGAIPAVGPFRLDPLIEIWT